MPGAWTGASGRLLGERGRGQPRREAHLPGEDRADRAVRVPERGLLPVPRVPRFLARSDWHRPAADHPHQRPLHLRDQLRRGSYRAAPDARLLRAHGLRGGCAALQFDHVVGSRPGGDRGQHDRRRGGGRAVPLPGAGDAPADLLHRSPDIRVQHLQLRGVRRVRDRGGARGPRVRPVARAAPALLSGVPGLRTARGLPVHAAVEAGGDRGCAEDARGPLAEVPAHRVPPLRPVRPRLVRRRLHRRRDRREPRRARHRHFGGRGHRPGPGPAGPRDGPTRRRRDASTRCAGPPERLGRGRHRERGPGQSRGAPHQPDHRGLGCRPPAAPPPSSPPGARSAE